MPERLGGKVVVVLVGRGLSVSVRDKYTTVKAGIQPPIGLTGTQLRNRIQERTRGEPERYAAQTE